MTNDKYIFELLYHFIEQLSVEDHINILQGRPEQYWNEFIEKSKHMEGHFAEIRHMMKNIVSEINRKDRIKCQYCRIDEGLLTDTPVRPHDLCKRHRQEYETNMGDKTATQIHPAISGGVRQTGAIFSHRGDE